jgi:hypothetical protein
MKTTYDIFLDEKSFDRVLIVQQLVGQLSHFVDVAVWVNCAKPTCTISMARPSKQYRSMENNTQ